MRQNVSTKKLIVKVLYEKAARKMLVKLTTEVNFTKRLAQSAMLKITSTKAVSAVLIWCIWYFAQKSLKKGN